MSTDQSYSNCYENDEFVDANSDRNSNVNASNSKTHIEVAAIPATDENQSELTIAEVAGEFQLFCQFEDGAEARSNQMLYNLLAKCFKLYRIMSQEDTLEGKKLIAEMKSYVSARGIDIGGEKSKLLTQVLRCIFVKSEKHKYGAYYTVLSYAEKQGRTPENLVDFIVECGGIQAIRKLSFKANAKNVNKSVASKREVIIKTARTVIAGTQLAVIEGLDISQTISKEKQGNQFVLIATLLPDGTFAINAAVGDTTAVDAALFAYGKSATDISATSVE